MRVNTIAFLLITTFFLPIAAEEVELKTDKEKIGYAIGQQIGTNLKSQNLDINIETLLLSVKHALSGEKSRMSDEELQEALKLAQQMARQKLAEQAIKNLENGKKFLANNKKRKGVKTKKSGLQYEILTKGKGKRPKPSDTVKVHYRGSLLDGTEFDSSYKRDRPAEFPLQGVIKGWTEGLQLMKPGAKYKFFIPSELAYGKTGNARIPANSTLIFEVELLEIKK